MKSRLSDLPTTHRIAVLTILFYNSTKIYTKDDPK